MNKLKEMDLNDENLCSDFIKELFKIKSYNCEIQLLEPIKGRKLNSFELEMFEIDAYDEEIFTCQRLIIKNKIYNSIEYTKLSPNKSSGIVKYKVQNEFFFGQISYFIEIENYFYIAINPYEIISNNLMSSSKVRIPNELQFLKDEKYFNDIFFVARKQLIWF